jgi:hypothetical protein
MKKPQIGDKMYRPLDCENDCCAHLSEYQEFGHIVEIAYTEKTARVTIEVPMFAAVNPTFKAT